MNTSYDVLIVGGGPGGLQAALSLGRARRRVLLCDSGPRRNAAAKGVNNFVTRDGVAPEQFRSEARAQLERYPNVEVRDARVERLTGARGAFDFGFGSARRVLLATGMVDEPPALEGLTPLCGGTRCFSARTATAGKRARVGGTWRPRGCRLRTW